MWNALIEIINSAMHGGAAGVLVIVIIAWMADRYLLVRDLKQLNQQMIDAFKENASIMSELSTLIGQLCQRI